MYLVSIIQADGQTWRQINYGLDLAECIYKRFHEISASYYDWQIVKDWILQTN